VKRAHVVGNGPSYIDFERIDPEDLVVGCNITRINADFTTLSDLRLAYQIRNALHVGKPKMINCPVLVNQKIYDWLQTSKGQQCKLDIHDVYKTYGNEPFDLSSGHYAAMWLIEQGYDEIHVWGVDSYFDDHILSYTDEYVESGTKRSTTAMSKVATRWKKEWDKLPVKIHAPSS